jgi:predicted nicotinamide N-methyase
MEESIDPAHSIDSYPEVIARGIGESFDAVRPKKVLIIGAGMAGLVAVYELKRAAHDHGLADQEPVLALSRLRDRPGRDPVQLHLVAGCGALGIDCPR